MNSIDGSLSQFHDFFKQFEQIPRPGAAEGQQIENENNEQENVDENN